MEASRRLLGNGDLIVGVVFIPLDDKFIDRLNFDN